MRTVTGKDGCSAISVKGRKLMSNPRTRKSTVAVPLVELYVVILSLQNSFNLFLSHAFGDQ